MESSLYVKRPLHQMTNSTDRRCASSARLATISAWSALIVRLPVVVNRNGKTPCASAPSPPAIMRRPNRVATPRCCV